MRGLFYALGSAVAIALAAPALGGEVYVIETSQGSKPIAVKKDTSALAAVPAMADGKANQGFTYEEASQMHDVALKMGGGGDYRILALDNAGLKYEWRCWYPPTQFAAKPLDPVSQAGNLSTPPPPAPWVGSPHESQWMQAQLAASQPQYAPPPQAPSTSAQARVIVGRTLVLTA
jgi:hypothetical protein